MAHTHNQFVDFLNKLTTPKNAALMEAIKKGYKAVFEATSINTPEMTGKQYVILIYEKTFKHRPTLADAASMPVVNRFTNITEPNSVYWYFPDDDKNVKKSDIADIEATEDDIINKNIYVELVNKPNNYIGYRITAPDANPTDKTYHLHQIKLVSEPTFSTLPHDASPKWRETSSSSERHNIRYNRFINSTEGREQRRKKGDELKLKRFAAIAKAYDIDTNDFGTIDIPNRNGNYIGSAIGYELERVTGSNATGPDERDFDTLIKLAEASGLKVQTMNDYVGGIDDTSYIYYYVFDPNTFVPYGDDDAVNEDYL